MKIAYARVSSREQSENSHALEQQIARLESSQVDRVIQDVESGSKNSKSPGFRELMDLVKEGKVAEIVVTRLDRLTRSLSSLQKTMEILKAHGVALVSLDDSIDTSTAAGVFHLNMLGALAEMEVGRLSERVRHGWSHLRDRRVAMNPPFGYRKENDQHVLDTTPFLCLISDRSEWSRAKISRYYIDTFLQERSIRLTLRVVYPHFGIQVYRSRRRGPHATRLIRFSPTAFSQWLTNPVLQGHLSYRRNASSNRKREDPKTWQIIPNTHEPLITAEEAAMIKQILSRNRQVKGFGSPKRRHSVSGLVFCGECRSPCYHQSGCQNYARSKRLGIPQIIRRYYQCKNWRSRACPQKAMVSLDIIEEAVIAALISRAEDLAKMADTPAPTPEPLALRELRSQLADLNRMAYNPAIENAKAQIKNQIAGMELDLTHTTQESSRLGQLISALADPDFWKEGLEPNEKSQLFQDLVSQVIIKDGAVLEVKLKV